MRNFFWFFCGGLLFLLNVFFADAQTPVKFVENKNQWSADIDFMARIPGGRMVVGGTSFRYFFLDHERLDALHHQSHNSENSTEPDEYIRGHAVFVDFPGADPDASPVAFGASRTYYNYYVGDDPDRWAAGAHAYQGAFYESFFPGIDMKVYGFGQHVKYDFVVAPGADPGVITAVYRGAEGLHMDNGNLVVRTTLGDVVERRPIAWQIIDGHRVDVPCEFVLQENQLSFLFPNGFDSCYELTIDPLLIFSTFSGSTADNWGSTATPGEHGNLYSAGVTVEEEGGVFPASPGAYQKSSAGVYDVGILKYDSLGQELLYATYLGGSGNESPHSLVMNSANEVLLLGTTSSSNFPTTELAFDRSFNGGTPVGNVIGYPYTAGCDIFISRFNPDGSKLLASTFVGGSSNDGLNSPSGDLTKNYGDQLRGDIITDGDNNVYVSSVTSSDDFPVANSFALTYNGGPTDAIVFKMDPELSSVSWGSFVGGSETDAAHTIKIDSHGNVFAGGGTNSPDFLTTVDSYQPAHNGDVDGWIAKIAIDGASLLHSTLTGTVAYDQVYFLDLNDNDEVYVYGQTSGNFPVTPGVYYNPGSGQFIQKFTSALDALIFSTVFGAGRGIPDISPTAFLVNDCNNLYMSGWGGRVNSETGYWNSGTTGMTTTADAFQLTSEGSDFYFLVLTDDAKERLYATFLGGDQSSTHVDGGTSRFDKSGIVYHSVCSGCRYFNDANAPTSDFPTTAGVWSRLNRSPNCNNAAFKFDLSSLKARIRTNSVRRDAPGLNTVCIPDAIGFENRSTGGELFYWDFGDGTTTVEEDTTFITHAYKAPGQYVVTLSAVDLGTCQVVDRTSVLVKVFLAQSFIQDDADLCFGDSHQLIASGGVQYDWTSADRSLVSHEATPVVAPKDTMSYYLTLTEANGCVRKDTVQINVIPGITPEFEWTRFADCSTRPEISVQNLTDSLKGSDSWFFDFGDGTTSDRDGEMHAFEEDGVFDVRIVTQREFCVYEKTVAIPVFQMFIPNIITPGVPEHNDVFTIRFGDVDGVTPGDHGYHVSLSIYNRWGERVFETDDYQYDWSGEGLAAGTYFYEVTVEGHATCKGWVQVVR